MHAASLDKGCVMPIDPSTVLWSAPERERAGRPLLVLLHGYGSHEGDLFGLAPGLPLEPVIASVRAPLSIGHGFAWAPLSAETPPDALQSNADAAAADILAWLDTTESTSVGVLGFSQGGAMALQLLRNAPERFAYAVVLSGFVVDGATEKDAALAAVKPPVFWGRGTADPVIQGEAVERTARWLPAHSTLTERVYEELTHSISNPELRDVAAFISSQL